jgi:sporulation protein YlmC with PRC-barrel domain
MTSTCCSSAPQVGKAAPRHIRGREQAWCRCINLETTLQGENIMARSIAHPNHQCVSSEDVQGTEVYGPDGNHIGEIDHLIIDKLSGRVAYAVMSFGGFLGLGHSHYPIPWGALRYDTSLGGFRTNVTEQQLKDAPEFSDDSWQDRDWETRTHRHYGTQGYWESRTGL